MVAGAAPEIDGAVARSPRSRAAESHPRSEFPTRPLLQRGQELPDGHHHLFTGEQLVVVVVGVRDDNERLRGGGGLVETPRVFERDDAIPGAGNHEQGGSDLPDVVD